MTLKRYVVELGYGADLHGNDATKAACRAVKDAVSRSCLCGLMEILGRDRFQGIHVKVLVACPCPEQVDYEAVKAMIPIGEKEVKVVKGGMTADGICVDQFGAECDSILVANAAVTVFVDME
jgi:uncharacterized protein (TIGR02058 family)